MERMQRMIVEIGKGVSVEDSTMKLTKEEKQEYRELEKDIQTILNKGGIVEIPGEFEI